MKNKFYIISLNVIKYDFTFVTKGGPNPLRGYATGLRPFLLI